MSYVILGTAHCEFCTKAKHLMREKRVPQIWDNNGDYIGGYTELALQLKGK
jgi:glutaredoxin